MIVLDNSVLSAYNRLRHLGILKELFIDVVIPPAVFSEFIKGWGTKDLPQWITVKESHETNLEESRIPNLGEGESQAIILARDNNWLLGIDDEKARGVALRMGVKVIGSLGILRIAYEKCLVETKKELQTILESLSKDLYLENWLIEWILEAEKE